MSDRKVAVESDDWVVEPAMTLPETFTDLMGRKRRLEEELRELNRKTIQKCLDEGWDDCLTIQWNKVSQRASRR